MYPVRKLRNFYPGVAEHKDISKLVVLLSSSVNSVRKAASEALQDFQKYKALWTEDRDAKVQVNTVMRLFGNLESYLFMQNVSFTFDALYILGRGLHHCK